MKKSTARMGNLGIKALEWFRKPAVDALKASKRFDPPSHIEHLASMAKEIVSLETRPVKDGSLPEKCWS